MEMDGKHKVLLRETGLDNEELLVSMVTHRVHTEWRHMFAESLDRSKRSMESKRMKFGRVQNCGEATLCVTMFHARTRRTQLMFYSHSKLCLPSTVVLMVLSYYTNT